MKTAVNVLAVCSLCFANLAVADEADDAKKIQGTWIVVSSEDGGRKPPEEELKNLQIVIEQERMLLKRDGKTLFTVEYKLDPSKKPKWIDLTTVRDDKKERTNPGIYELKGDSLKICFPESGKKRSTKFESKPDSENDVLIVLKRAKKEP